ncbi:MAG: hypothetical protein LBD24_09405, partial [Spirochaetaceae bacterium]|nr:hypothetical protein [Spirochaetaceae bacterium]
MSSMLAWAYIILLALLAAQVILLVIMIIGRRSREPALERLADRLEQNERAVRDELSKNREEIQKTSQSSREELGAAFFNFTDLLEGKLGKLENLKDAVDNAGKESRRDLSESLKSFEERFSGVVREFTDSQRKNFSGLIAGQDDLTGETRKNFEKVRESMDQSLTSFEERFSGAVREFTDSQRKNFSDLIAGQDGLTRETREIFEKIRESVERRLQEIQRDNSVKLEQMRETVGENLNRTLDARLGESFKTVREQLDQVQKYMGEMQNLANSVGDLNRVISNV